MMHWDHSEDGLPENRTSTAHQLHITAHQQKSRYRGMNANNDITLAFQKQDRCRHAVLQ